MDRRYRLTGFSDFKRVRRTGKSHAHPLVVLVACRNDRPSSRIAVTAGKTVGTAVRRNRARRRLRAAMRGLLPHVADGWDLILIARPGVVEAAWPDVQRAVEAVMRRGGALPREIDDD
jgi:ribonuclease P protein component